MSNTKGRETRMETGRGLNLMSGFQIEEILRGSCRVHWENELRRQ
jgi:hypothetical protein